MSNLQHSCHKHEHTKSRRGTRALEWPPWCPCCYSCFGEVLSHWMWEKNGIFKKHIFIYLKDTATQRELSAAVSLLTCVTQIQALWSYSIAFRATLAGIWITKGAIGTQWDASITDSTLTCYTTLLALATYFWLVEYSKESGISPWWLDDMEQMRHYSCDDSTVII